MWKQLSGTPYHRKASLVPLVLIDSIKLVVDSEWVYWLTTRELNKDATYSYLPSTVEARYCFLAISSHFGRILCRLLGGGLSRLQERLLWIAADIIYRNNNREYWQAVKFIKSIGVCLPPWLSCQIYGQWKSRFVRENIQRRPNESCRQGAKSSPNRLIRLLYDEFHGVDEIKINTKKRKENITISQQLRNLSISTCTSFLLSHIQRKGGG
jgi:hypothetical protein